MIIKILTFFYLYSNLKLFTVDDILNQLPRDYLRQNQILFDPNNYLSDQTKYGIYEHMQNIQKIEQFQEMKNIFILIDKYEMPDAWIQNITKFTENLLQKMITSVNDRFNSLFIVYSIKDRQYRIRTGKQFNKYYFDQYAEFNAKQIKTLLQEEQYDQAFETLYKNIDQCLYGKQNYCYQNKTLFYQTILASVFLIIMTYILIKKCYRCCFKKEELNEEVHKRLKTLQEMKKNNENCCICLDKLNNDEIQDKKNKEVFLLCGHNFHDKCIQNWLQKKDECPICRKKVEQCDSKQKDIINNFTNEAEIIQVILDIHQLLSKNNQSSFDCCINDQCFKFTLDCCSEDCCKLVECCLSGGTSGSW